MPDLPSLACPRRLLDSAVLSDYWALTKPEVNFLIVITTFAGFYLGSEGTSRDFPFLRMIHALLGTLLVASGTGTLNQYIERRFDSQMRRTKRRPVAAGRINPSHALWFGIVLSAAGTVYLAAAVNLLASLISVLTLLSYLMIYTPLKRRTPLCVLIGAFPGAAPPLIGWAAAAGKLSVSAWILYGIVFMWQFPHFMAIAWMYREDYDRAGYMVLPSGDRRNRFVAWQSMLPFLVLLPLSVAPMLLEHDGWTYGIASLLLTMCFLYYSAQLLIRRSTTAARRLLLASILYLPLIFGLMVFDRAQ